MADPAIGAVGAEAIPADQDALRVLEQGPVHEAYAEPVTLEAAEGIVVNQAPPEPVNELPPEVMPEGNNVQWISGYWMWSEPQNDFIWVSGVWREIPPGRRWVPGHWLEAGGQFEWVPGFWAAEAVQEVNLLPTPPDTLEAGPTSAAPGDNYFWIPGCWIRQTGDYVWRPGYWYVGQANWVWVPDHYCYTSYGAYFVNGYWDYPLASRGLLYAPVYWTRPIYTRPGYFYRPYSVVNSALLLTALFVNPYHSHYYYGYGWGNNDFYRPWWSSGWGRGYDPFYAYHRWHDGRNRHDWHDHVRRDWDRRHHDWDRDDWDRGDWDGDRDRGDWDGDDRDRGDRDRDGRGPRPDDLVDRPREYGNELVTTIDDLRREHGDRLQLRDLNESELQNATERAQNWRRIREARTSAAADAAARAGRGEYGLGNALDNIARDRRGVAGGQADAGGEASAQAGVTEPDNGRRLQIGSNEGTPQSSFRLPPVERSGDANVQARTRADANVGNAQAEAAARLRGAGGSRDAASAFRSGESNREAILQRFNIPSAGQDNTGPSRVGGMSGNIDRGRIQPRQGNANNLATPGRAGIGTSQPGRAFRYSPAQGQQNRQIPSGGIEQRTLRVPSGGENRNIRVPSASGRDSSIRTPSSSPNLRVPSGGANLRVPSSSGRSFSVPSGGGQRSFSIPSRGVDSRSIRVPSGGSSVRGLSRGGGQPTFRSGSGGGGGGQQLFRGGGGGVGRDVSGGGGGGNRGRGRGRD